MTIRNSLVVLLMMFSPMVMAAEAATVAVLDTELIIDNKPTPHSPDRPGEIERAGYMTDHIRKVLDESAAYELVSIEPARETVDNLSGSIQYLHECETCIAEIGQALNVDYVATVWVQVVSNLIINFNLVLHDAETGKAVKTSFIDIRGNNNSSWRTGTNYLLEKFFNEYHDQLPRQALKAGQSVWPAS